MHNVNRVYYMMKLAIHGFIMYGVYVACSISIGLLIMFYVMGIHMYIALEILDWYYECSSIMFYVK